MAKGAEVRLSKSGPSGKPFAEVLVDKDISAGDLSDVIQRVTTDKDLLRKVGLRACPGCKSGLDIWVRERFDAVINVGG